MIGLHWWQIRPRICLKMRQKALVPIRQIGTNPFFPTTSEQTKPAPMLGFMGFVPMFRVFRTILNGLGLKRLKNTILCHLLKPAGAVVLVNLRRIKQPSKRRAGHAPTCAALACRMVCAAAVTICPTPTHLATPCAVFLTTAGFPAAPGRFMKRW